MTVCQYLWHNREPKVLSPTKTTGQVWSRELHHFGSQMFIKRIVQGIRETVGSLLVDNRIELFANPALRRVVQHTHFTLNDYVLFDVDAPFGEYYSYPRGIQWPSDAPEVLSQTKWIPLTWGPTFPSMRMLLDRDE